jgi:predicted secreted protein
VFLSHCLLNENVRYLGGAFRSGGVDEVVSLYLENGTGICQMPCPEQRAWGGVLKRYMLALYGRQWPSWMVRLLAVIATSWTALRYRLLARRVAREVADYCRAGFQVVEIVGIGGSPSCGVSIRLDLGDALREMVACPLRAMDRDRMNEIIREHLVSGAGLYTAALRRELARRGLAVPFREHSLLEEMKRCPAPHSTKA